jgi:hypothetical protein
MYGLYRRHGRTWKRLRTHKLKTKSDAKHHARDIKAYNPKARIRIKRLRR